METAKRSWASRSRLAATARIRAIARVRLHHPVWRFFYGRTARDKSPGENGCFGECRALCQNLSKPACARSTCGGYGLTSMKDRTMADYPRVAVVVPVYNKIALTVRF